MGDGVVRLWAASVFTNRPSRPKSAKVCFGTYTSSATSTGFLLINCVGSKLGILRGARRPPPDRGRLPLLRRSPPLLKLRRGRAERPPLRLSLLKRRRLPPRRVWVVLI